MVNIRFAKDYVLHQLKAKTRHGTHSPFVYRLVDEVIYDFHSKRVYGELESLRRELLSDERLINVPKGALNSPKLAQLLYRLVTDRQPKNMFELGPGFGITSRYLPAAAPDAVLYTPAGPIGSIDKLDFVLFDGNRHKEETLRYFEWLLPKAHDGTLLVIGDIYRSEGMKEAWVKIKSHPQVTVTIDLFWVGLVYFKKGQAKEDFLIKI